MLQAYNKQFLEQCISHKANLLGCGTGWDEIRWGGTRWGKERGGEKKEGRGEKRRQKQNRHGMAWRGKAKLV